MPQRLVLVLLSIGLLSGCATANYTKQHVRYPERMPAIRTIAVMPMDVQMFRINTGGVREAMDEWSDQAKRWIKQDLERYLAPHFKEIKFVDEAALKSAHYDVWFSQKGLFNAVAGEVSLHAYQGASGFESKINTFDYTLGPEIKELAETTGADALLFVRGFDSQRTTGRVWMEALEAGLLGVYMYYYTVLNMGLVDARTGDLLWYKENNMMQDHNFTNQKDLEQMVKWFADDFSKKQ